MLMRATSKFTLTDNCEINFKKDPHILISGKTNSGKTNVLEEILLSVMSAKKGVLAKVFLVDGKGSDLSTLKNYIPVAITPSQAAKMLRFITTGMKKRYSRFSGNFGKVAADYQDSQGRTVQQIVLIIDELAVLLNDPRTRGEIHRYLYELLIAARQASIYVSPFGAKSCSWDSKTIS